MTQQTLNIEPGTDARGNADKEFEKRCNAAQRAEMEREMKKPLAADSIQERITGMDAAPDARGNLGLF